MLWHYRWGLLLAVLLASFCSLPFLDHRGLEALVSLVANAAIFAGAIWACAPPRRVMLFGYGSVLLWTLTSAEAVLAGTFSGHVILLALTALVVAGALVLVFLQLLTSKDTRHGLLSAAVFGYCLIALVYALLFAQVEATAPGSFRFADDLGSSSVSLLYLSIVTITTLGYGEITPVSDLARLLAGMEAMTGTLFIAIFIGRIVGRLDN